MKKTLLAALTLMAALPSAFAYTCRVDMVDMRGRVIDTFYAQEDFRGTCRDGLRDCNREMRTRGVPGADCVVRQGPGPGPGPGSGTGPGPGPRMDLEVTLMVESTLMELRGFSNSDIYNQCMTQVPFGSVDEIVMVTNNSRVRRLTTNGWWSNRQDVCNVVMQNLDFSGRQGRMIIDAYGSFENRPFNIRANTNAEALPQCVREYQISGLFQSDELSVAVGNMPMRRITTGGWWNNGGAVCHEVMKVIDSVIF